MDRGLASGTRGGASATSIGTGAGLGVGLTGRRLRLQVACGAGGHAALSVPGLANGLVALSAVPVCGGNRTVSFTLGKSIARQISGKGSVLAQIAFRQSGATETLR